MKKLQNLDSYYKQNYSNYKRKIISKCQNKPVDIMRKLIINYKTDINTQTCQCGESILISSMIGINLPGSHLHFLGMPFPKSESPKLAIENVFFKKNLSLNMILLNLMRFKQMKTIMKKLGIMFQK